MIFDPVIFYSLLGLVVGVLSGLLGIGGGLLMIPALLFLPELLGILPLSLTLITGLSAIQALASSISSSWTHYQRQRLIMPLAAVLGIAAMAGSYFGGLWSADASPQLLKITYIVISACALFGYLKRNKPKKNLQDSQSVEKIETLRQYWVKPKFYLCLLVAMGIGLLSGLLGIGGSIFMIPLMTALLGVSTYQAIGTAAGTVLLIATAAVIGKMQVGLIPWEEAIPIVISAFIGGRLGAMLTPKVSERWLIIVLVSLILLSNARFIVSFF